MRLAKSPIVSACFMAKRLRVRLWRRARLCRLLLPRGRRNRCRRWPRTQSRLPLKRRNRFQNRLLRRSRSGPSRRSRFPRLFRRRFRLSSRQLLRSTFPSSKSSCATSRRGSRRCGRAMSSKRSSPLSARISPRSAGRSPKRCRATRWNRCRSKPRRWRNGSIIPARSALSTHPRLPDLSADWPKCAMRCTA